MHLFFFFFQAEDGIRDLYVTGVQTCALPISANGAWFTPFTALGQVVALQSTSFPVARSRTFFEPGRMIEPTLSWTFEVAGSMARVPMSPQSIESAQRPAVNNPRVAPTSRLTSSGGAYFVLSL